MHQPLPKDTHHAHISTYLGRSHLGLASAATYLLISSDILTGAALIMIH